EPPSSPFRPLDEPENPWPRPLAESERLELGRIAKSVEVDVQRGETRELMDLEQGVGRTPDAARDARRAEKAAGEGGLPRAELPGEIENGQRAGIGTRARELPPERLGFLRGLGLDAHEASRD